MLKNIISNLHSEDWIQLILKNANIYVVGGSVRDALSGTVMKDIDMVVEGMGLEDVKNLLKQFGKVSIVGESFSVIKFRPFGHVGEDYDIAVPRRDRKLGAGHKNFAIETEGVDILGDLKRRDFTINSIAVNVKTGEILDPFHGIDDLKSKVLRATDSNAFIEDPLRMVRAIQFAARFRFNIEPKTLQLMKNNAKLIKEITGERILEEFEKILHKNGSTRVAFELMEKSYMDKALFNVKFHAAGLTEHFDNLDEVSFFYTLGILGNVIPSNFYLKRLKGKYEIGKALTTLEKYFTKFSNGMPEEELKWNIFQMLKTSPLLSNTMILHPNVLKVIKEMKAKKIPMKLGDIPVNGNDIMELFGVKNEDIGILMTKMYKDALMNKFNWKNKTETLKYLETL